MPDDFNNLDSAINKNRNSQDPAMSRMANAASLNVPKQMGNAFNAIPQNINIPPSSLADAPLLRQGFQSSGQKPIFNTAPPAPPAPQQPKPPQAPQQPKPPQQQSPIQAVPPQPPAPPQGMPPAPQLPQDQQVNQDPQQQPQPQNPEDEEKNAINQSALILKDPASRQQAIELAYAPGLGVQVNPQNPEVMAGTAAMPTDQTMTRLASLTTKDVETMPAGALLTDAADNSCIRQSTRPYNPDGNCFDDDGEYECPLSKQPCGKKSFFVRFIEALKMFFGISNQENMQRVIERENGLDPIYQKYARGGAMRPQQSIGRLSAQGQPQPFNAPQMPQAQPSGQTNLAEFQ